MKEHREISGNSVDLLISSVPIDILKHDLWTLFRHFRRIVRPNGWVLIDAPKEIGFSDIISAGKDRNIWWRESWNVWDMYPEIDQWLHIHSKENTNVPALPPHLMGHGMLKPKRTREMGHQCEFCPDIIGLFIELFSEPGDVVFDPFCGTGTVPGEAERMYRVGVGCDIRPASNIREEYQ